MAVNDPSRLPCGRDPLELEALVAGPDPLGAVAADDHVSTCPFCREVVDALLLQREAAAQLRGETVPAPAGFTTSVMRGVLAELRPGRWTALPTPDGPASVSELAIGQTLRRLVEQLPDVEVGELRLLEPSELTLDGLLPEDVDDAPPLRTSAPSGPGVRLEISVRLGRALAEVTGQIRSVVRTGMLTHLGLDCPTVDIAVVDLLDVDPVDELPVRGGQR